MADDRKPKEPQDLPEGWKWVRLGEVIEEVKERKGRRNISTVLTVSNTEGLVDQTEFFGRNLSSQDTTNYKVVYKGCFVYNPARINVGSIALNDSYEYAIVSPMYCVFRTKECLLPKYLSYWIQLPNFKHMVINNTAGSVRESLNFSRLITFDFPLPPLPEQRKIAQILETVDNAIEKTEKIIEKYKRIKQGLMQDLLTKGIDEKGNIRSEKTHKFKDSPLGRIPEEWEVMRLGEILIYEQPQKYIVKSEEYDEKSGVPVLTAGKTFILGYVDENEGICNDLPVILFDDFTTDSRYINFPFKVKSSATKILRARDESIDLFYVYNALKLISLKPGNDHKRFWISEYSKMFIPLPPLSEQKRIAEILSQIDQAIEKEEKYKQKLERLKKGLMEDLLTGKVRVNKLVEGEVNEMA